jgi:hypothetical protein
MIQIGAPQDPNQQPDNDAGLRFRLSPHVAAVVAFPFVNTNHAAAAWAPKPFSLLFQEHIHACSFEHFEVFDHAHPVSFSVSLV